MKRSPERIVILMFRGVLSVPRICTNCEVRSGETNHMKTMAPCTKSVVVIIFCMVCSFGLWTAATDKPLQISLLKADGFWTNFYGDMASWPDFYSATIYIYFALLIITIVLFCQIYKLFTSPINYVRYLGDVGYEEDGRLNKGQIAHRVAKARKGRRTENLPPIYPNGWFGIIESFELKKSQSRYIDVLGLDLAVFRDDQGQVHAIDAYCPHMGANLAVGGKVFGDCLECPFHGWRFRGTDGKCTHIPYADSVPDLARVKTWPVVELNGWICLWYHAEGLAPYWEIPNIEEITKGDWKYIGHSVHHVNAHIEDMSQNVPDTYHFYQIHGTTGSELGPTNSKGWDYINHEWICPWAAQPDPKGHIASVLLHVYTKLFAKRISFMDSAIKIEQVGPGIILQWIENRSGKCVVVAVTTPTGPTTVKVVSSMYVDNSMPAFVAKFIMMWIGYQINSDVRIWVNKRYEAKPVFVKSKKDTLLAQHRRWFQQFYSENSPRLKFQKDTMDW